MEKWDGRAPAEGRWEYRINYGPDGESNYANVYDAKGEFVGNLRTHFAHMIVEAMNSPRCEPPGEAVPTDVEDEMAAARITRAVAELPDRTSPEDQPEMMLVSEGELFDLLVPAIATQRHRGWKACQEAAANALDVEDDAITVTRYGVALDRGSWRRLVSAIRSLTPPKDEPT